MVACAMAGRDGDLAACASVAMHSSYTLRSHSIPLKGADLSEAHLGKANLSGMDLRECDLQDAVLRGTHFHGAHLDGACLRTAYLERADFTKATLRSADLRGAYLRDALLRATDLQNARLNGADLTGADLQGAVLYAADLTQARLVAGRLRGAALGEAQLIDTDLRWAELSNCSVGGASIRDVQLTNATQANLYIAPHNDLQIIVDRLEVAQQLAILLQNEQNGQLEPTHAISGPGTSNNIVNNIVLILGRFPHYRHEPLETLRNAVRARGYVPVVFDFGRPATNEQTTRLIALLTRLARYIVADLNDYRSARFQLATIVPLLTGPMQVLLLEGKASATMSDDLLIPSGTFNARRYATMDALLAGLATLD